MNKFTFSLALIVLALGLVASLIWLTAEGNIAAAIVLGAVSAIVLILTGFALYAFAGWTHAKREQVNFMANVKENLGIMGAVQRVQNQQNKHLLNQVRQQPALPAGDVLDLDSALQFDENIFIELDGVGNDQ